MPLVPTAHLDASVLAGARLLCEEAFEGRFAPEDWTHALGGLHAVLLHDGWEHREGDVAPVAAHGALVARRFLHGPDGAPTSLRVGYVEAVAVAAGERRRGCATRVMTALESLAPGYDLLALSASAAARPLYLGRGWVPWAGPTGVLAPSGTAPSAIVPTPEEDDGVLLLPGALDPASLDRGHPLVCDWRDGDVW
ncbi:aminoglycoside N-acetyltransferase AAC(2')-Ib [Nocardioides sp. GY 10127]|nr:aminoglycoside N-acetyltransferase AAC(2')-Ib [Nocardioides sp. GY 10127]